MKRVLIAILLLGILMFASACGSKSVVSPYVGTWTVHEVLSEGMSIPADKANIVMTITFNEDGTYDLIVKKLEE